MDPICLILMMPLGGFGFKVAQVFQGRLDNDARSDVLLVRTAISLSITICIHMSGQR